MEKVNLLNSIFENNIAYVDGSEFFNIGRAYGEYMEINTSIIKLCPNNSFLTRYKQEKFCLKCPENIECNGG